MNNTLKDYFEKISEVKQRTDEEIIKIANPIWDNLITDSSNLADIFEQIPIVKMIRQGVKLK